jgi:ATP-dependent helicase/DNAse subunit B
MKKVAAFIHGNGVPVEMAAECYVVCRGREHIQAILSWYYTWSRETHKRHMSEFYNIRNKTHFPLNGKSLNQEELWLPETRVMEIGVKGIIDRLFPGWERVLLNAIDYVRGKVGHDSFQDGRVS